MKMEDKDSFAKFETLIREVTAYSNEESLKLENMFLKKKHDAVEKDALNKNDLLYAEKRLKRFKKSLDKKKQKVERYLEGFYENNEEDDVS